MPPRPERGRPRPTADQIVALRERAEAQAKEVLEHMYQAILKTPEFVLSDGTKCRVDAYYEPQVNADGELQCGFDVLTGDSHLEFTVGNTGWGRGFAPSQAAPRPRKGPAR